MCEDVTSSELNDKLPLEACLVLQYGLDSLESKSSGGTLFGGKFENCLKLL